MYVSVVTVHVQPGKLDEVWRRLREAVPDVQAIRGFREARFQTDAHTDTVLRLTLWETEADARAAPVAGAEGGRLRDLLTAPGVVAFLRAEYGVYAGDRPLLIPVSSVQQTGGFPTPLPVVAQERGVYCGCVPG
jgi:hypothetical protein